MHSSHASVDIESRIRKAAKIDRVLRLPAGRKLRILDVGAGSGAIAAYFARHPHLETDVSAVDVADQRVVTDGFAFTLVSDTTLPFADASFDLVISNHVIEHVGEADAQRAHLREIARVLAPDGRAYLACPSRWCPIEPHFGLPLLSWLPRGLSHAYVRMAKRGTHYDCWPPTWSRLRSLSAAAGLEMQNLFPRALQDVAANEARNSLVVRTAAALLGERGARWLTPIAPTYIVQLTHRA